MPRVPPPFQRFLSSRREIPFIKEFTVAMHFCTPYSQLPPTDRVKQFRQVSPVMQQQSQPQVLKSRRFTLGARTFVYAIGRLSRVHIPESANDGSAFGGGRSRLPLSIHGVAEGTRLTKLTAQEMASIESLRIFRLPLRYKLLTDMKFWIFSLVQGSLLMEQNKEMKAKSLSR